VNFFNTTEPWNMNQLLGDSGLQHVDMAMGKSTASRMLITQWHTPDSFQPFAQQL
jgi:hypothetical protein